MILKARAPNWREHDGGLCADSESSMKCSEANRKLCGACRAF